MALKIRVDKHKDRWRYEVWDSYKIHSIDVQEVVIRGERHSQEDAFAAAQIQVESLSGIYECHANAGMCVFRCVSLGRE